MHCAKAHIGKRTDEQDEAISRVHALCSSRINDE